MRGGGEAILVAGVQMTAHGLLRRMADVRSSRLLKKSPSPGLEDGFIAIVESDFDGHPLKLRPRVVRAGQPGIHEFRDDFPALRLAVRHPLTSLVRDRQIALSLAARRHAHIKRPGVPPDRYRCSRCALTDFSWRAPGGAHLIVSELWDVSESDGGWWDRQGCSSGSSSPLL